jgi:hypothetical protein
MILDKGGKGMNINRCKTCKHYENFFGSCKLYVKDVYLGEGDWDVQPVGIKSVSESECEYEEVRE